MSDPQNRNDNGDRDPTTGRFAPGNRANPGGRPRVPDFVKERGPDAWRHLLAIADGEEDDPRVSRGQATLEVLDRVYGRATQAVEVDGGEGVSPVWEAVIDAVKRIGREPPK